MASLDYNNNSTFKERLINLCIKDMNTSDITSLILHGFKGFENFTEEELIESVVDRYELHDPEVAVYELTKSLIGDGE